MSGRVAQAVRIGAVVSVIVLFVSVTQSLGLWTAAPALPRPQLQHGMVAIAGRLYVVGGAFDIQSPPTAAGVVTVYHPQHGAWTTRAAPTARINHGTAALGTDICLVGGLFGRLFGESSNVNGNRMSGSAVGYDATIAVTKVQ